METGFTRPSESRYPLATPRIGEQNAIAPRCSSSRSLSKKYCIRQRSAPHSEHVSSKRITARIRLAARCRLENQIRETGCGTGASQLGEHEHTTDLLADGRDHFQLTT